MVFTNSVEPNEAAIALDVINEYTDGLYERAPVMMHSVDREGRLVGANRRWLRRLGYTRGEILGRKSTDFLTDESRLRAVEDTLPLFWRVGSAHSVGYRFVPKNGRVFDVFLDAEVSYTASGHMLSYAAIRKAHDLRQWEQSSTTLEALMKLTRARRNLESLIGMGLEKSVPEVPAMQDTPTPTLEAQLVKEALPALLELTEDISRSMRGLLRVHEEWLGETAEQQRELLLVAKSIDRTLGQLGDNLPADRLTSE